MEEWDVKRRRNVSLRTETTGWELEKQDRAAGMYEYFGDLDGPKEGDAKMRLRGGTGGSLMAVSIPCGR